MTQMISYSLCSDSRKAAAQYEHDNARFRTREVSHPRLSEHLPSIRSYVGWPFRFLPRLGLTAGAWPLISTIWTVKRLHAIRFAGTWRACLWVVLVLGHARTSQLTGQQGNGKRQPCPLFGIRAVVFSFFLTLWATTHYEAFRAALSFPWGDSFVFCSFLLF